MRPEPASTAAPTRNCEYGARARALAFRAASISSFSLCVIACCLVLDSFSPARLQPPELPAAGPVQPAAASAFRERQPRCATLLRDQWGHRPDQRPDWLRRKSPEPPGPSVGPL